MAGSRRFTKAKRELFLGVLQETCNVSRAAIAAGVSRSAAYACRHRDESFARAWDEAIDAALDGLEEELLRRAREGVEKPVHYQGKLIASTRNYSDQLAMFLLKARRPEVFGDSGGGGGFGGSVLREARASLERKLAGLAAGGQAPAVFEQSDRPGSSDPVA
ncbi:MAG: terminase [Alphaproteobacteria bacterium]